MVWINWVLSSWEETHLKSEFPFPGYRIKFLKQFDFAKQSYHPYILKCQRILSSLKHFWKPVFLFGWVRVGKESFVSPGSHGHYCLLVSQVLDPLGILFSIARHFLCDLAQIPLALCLLVSMAVIMWVVLIPLPPDRGEVCRNWYNSCMGVLNNSSIPCSLCRKKIKTVGDKCSQGPSNRNDGNDYTFYYISNRFRLHDAGSHSDKLYLVTFGGNEAFQLQLLSLCGTVKSHFQALSGQPRILIVYPK